MADNDYLHLPDLTIKGFRGIGELSIPRLGRVTLLAGMNSIGKTTVLDAVEVYAARGRYSTLYQLLTRRDEVLVGFDEDGDPEFEPSWAALFHGRDDSEDLRFAIGPKTQANHLTIQKTFLAGKQLSLLERYSGQHFPDDRIQALKISYLGVERQIPLGFIYGRGARKYILHRGFVDLPDEEELPRAIECESLGPGLMGNNSVARFWDNVALTEDENNAVRALRLIFADDIDRVAVVGDERSMHGLGGRRAMVKLRSFGQPVPLKSLGDGALRMFGVALALANSKNGFLLIDEAENGIHHTVQYEYWRMILQSARMNNVQVFATTHSGDCVRGFARAASELENIEGVLVRLSRQHGDLHAIEYSEEELTIADEQGIEVR